ncbi:hypothetical protein ACFWBF_11580 [Streptomyces sp. NPDC060028]|uniref:hypothetical protein n=1 Tax=Streptomyces sp. NPDC060028 TaxID=3347041 RepID=UPI00368EF438
MTDTANTPDLYGRFIHFRTPGAYPHSIYWSPDTGAHVVLGAIRGHWSEQGWENGTLGFPTSDEYVVTNGARSDFQGGYVRWNGTTATVTRYAYGTGEGTARIVLSGDFNGDKRSDMATIVDYGSCRAALWTHLGTPTSGLSAPFESWKAPVNTWCVTSAKYAAADVNGDGRSDIIGLYVYADNAVRVFTGLARPDGTHPGFDQDGWSAPAGSWQLDPVKLFAGDTDGDGRADLTAMYRYGSGRMGLFQFPGGADGTLGTPEMTVDTGYGNWEADRSWPLAGDENGDGRSDMSALYDYGNGVYATFTFIAGANGKYSNNNALKSWDAPAGTW